MLMSLLEGEAGPEVPATDAWLRSLAATAVQVHSSPLDGLTWLPRRLDQLVSGLSTAPAADLSPADRELRELLAARPGALPNGSDGLVHRDFWAGNTLRNGGDVVAVLDWPSAAIGPAEVDAAECSFDLVLSQGWDAAERFLAAWSELAQADLEGVRAWWGPTVLNSANVEVWIAGWAGLGVEVNLATALERREEVRSEVLRVLRG